MGYDPWCPFSKSLVHISIHCNLFLERCFSWYEHYFQLCISKRAVLLVSKRIANQHNGKSFCISCEQILFDLFRQLTWVTCPHAPQLPQGSLNIVQIEFFLSLLTIWNKSKQVNQNPSFTSIPWENLEWWHVLSCLPVWAAACWHTTTVYKTPTSFVLSFLPFSSFLIPDYSLTISQEFKWHKPICHANVCCPLPCQQVLKKRKKIWYKNATTTS